MNNKILITIMVILLFTGLTIGFAFRNNNSAKKQITTAYDDMSSHHGGSASVSNDPANTDLKPITFNNAVGQQAPDFELINRDGTKTRLNSYLGKTVIIFFNEGAMCYPACWSQIASLANDQRLNDGNIVALSIVTDSKSQWDQIINSQPKLRGANILFDTNKAVSQAYDVLNLPSSMHKGSSPGHTYFIIDAQGRIVYVLDDPNMAINNNLLIAKLFKT